jgi:type II secretory pathway component GspD/PulD (secretin)
MVPDQAFVLLDMLKSEIGRVMVDPESGNVLVMDSPGRIEMMEKALSDFEEKNTIRVIKLQYAKAKDIEEALKNQLDAKKVGSIKADERGNQVVVQTLPERMDQIEKMVKTLDQKTKEILIDVSIIKIKISNELDTGVNWEGLFDTGVKYGLSYIGSTPFSSVQSSTDAWRSRLDTYNAVGGVGSYPFSGTTSNYSSSSRKTGLEELHFGMITQNRDFDVVLKFIATAGKTKILSNPKLAVINNQEAKIHVGQKEAYITTTTTTGQTTNTVAEQVTFVDVGVLLSVVPIINDDGFVNLKVKAEISSVIDTLVTPTDNRIPIIDTSLAETTVLVKDGSTVVIGGLRKDTKVDSSKQVPFFGSIPFIGRLFGNKSNATERSELLIMLTPKMITGEVLVSESGAKNTVGGVAMKPMKDYYPMPAEPLESGAGSEKIFIPPEGGRLEIKGLRK